MAVVPSDACCSYIQDTDDKKESPGEEGRNNHKIKHGKLAGKEINAPRCVDPRSLRGCLGVVGDYLGPRMAYLPVYP